MNKEEKIPLGLVFLGERDTTGEFSGSAHKTGILIAKVGDKFASTFVEFYGGFLNDGQLQRKPRLATTTRWMVKTAVHDCSPSGTVCYTATELCQLLDSESEQKRKSKKSMIDKIVDGLQRGKCPQCGQEEILDWYQADPLSPEVLKAFDQKNRITGEGAIKGLKHVVSSDPDDGFQIPGVVALMRCDVSGDEDHLPKTPHYHSLVEWAHGHTTKDGVKAPLRVELLNNIVLDGANLWKLVLVADDFTVGRVPYSWLDDGFRSDKDLPYQVFIRLGLRDVAAGKDQVFRSKAWADAHARAVSSGGQFTGARLRDVMSSF